MQLAMKLGLTFREGFFKNRYVGRTFIMTAFLIVLYGVVMVSGIYGLALQHYVPKLMKERLPAEAVYEQIPFIRSQLCREAEKMRDALKGTASSMHWLDGIARVN